MYRILVFALALYLAAKIFKIIVIPFFRGFGRTSTTSPPSPEKKKKYHGKIVEAKFEDISGKNSDRANEEQKP